MRAVTTTVLLILTFVSQQAFAINGLHRDLNIHCKPKKVVTPFNSFAPAQDFTVSLRTVKLGAAVTLDYDGPADLLINTLTGFQLNSLTLPGRQDTLHCEQIADTALCEGLIVKQGRQLNQYSRFHFRMIGETAVLDYIDDSGKKNSINMQSSMNCTYN